MSSLFKSITPKSATHVPEPPIARFLFADTRMAWFWLLVRLYCGWEWVTAGWGKVQNPAWFGPGAGSALTGGSLSDSTAACSSSR